MAVRLLLLLAVVALAACNVAPPVPVSVVHEAYVWQRQWDDALRTALVESRDFIGAVRVLALQRDDAARWVEPAPDLAALAADGRAVTAVVRIDGRLAPDDAPATLDRIVALAARWREAGVVLSGVEIDHDCATARLDAYAAWLARLRAALPASLRLSVTALPAWRSAPALSRVFDAVDETVLQVHAVLDPAQGLFVRAQAREWIDAWSRRATKPWLVALPAYGAALRLDADGEVIAVESERALASKADEVREMTVDPREVAALLRELVARPPPRWHGVVWFRLPREGDRRTWKLATLRAVAQARPLIVDLRVMLRPAANGALDVVATNAGLVDASLPSVLRVDRPCQAGDAIGVYRYEAGTARQYFRRTTRATLRAGGERVIGWLRCDNKEMGHAEAVVVEAE